MDDTDRLIISTFQGGFPLTPTPYADAAAQIGLGEAEFIERLAALLDGGALTRFGPLYNVDRMGGGFCLCAMRVPQERFDEVCAIVNAHFEVAHNYAREHEFNMWFVLAVEDPDDIDRLCHVIAGETGIAVYPFPKSREFFIDFRVEP